MRSMLTFIYVGFLLLISNPELISQKISSELTGKIDVLFQEWNTDTTPGVAIGVIQDGELVFSKGYGMANLEHKIPITPNSVFDIASVSKQFCAFSIAMLADEGSIALDDDIRKYIPEVPDFGHTITIRHLVHHISGIRDWPMTLRVGGWQFDEVISMDQILHMVETQQDLNFVPGAEYSYSNTGYNLLAEVIARVTGQSFREWTDENIFKPLEMNNTHFHDDHHEIVPKRVQGFYQEGNLFKMMSNNLMALGSSSLFTTVEDLSKWAINFETGAVGGQKVLNQVHERGILNNGDTIAYAFGHSIGEYKNFKRISHSGGWAGFRTYLVRFPTESLSIVLLSNYASFNPGGKSFELADLFLPLKEVEPSEELETTSESQPSSKYVAAEIDPSIFDDYEGEYELVPGFILKFWRDGNQYFVRATGQSQIEMTASSDSTFFVEQVQAEVVFHRKTNGEVNSLTLNQGGSQKAQRIDPYTPTDEDIEEIIGVYYSPELKTFYEINRDENQELTFIHQRLGKSSLVLEDKNLLSSSFINPINIIRDEAGKIIRLEVGQGRMRNVRLAKIEEGEFPKYD